MSTPRGIFSRWIRPLFSRTPQSFTDDEVGQRMRRFMEKATWFDRLSAWWFDRPWSVKIGAILGITLIGLLVGFAAGFPLFMGVGALLFGFIGHQMLVSHTQSRYAAAKAFAIETQALSDALKASKALLDNAIVQWTATTGQLQTQGAALQTQSDQLSHQQEKIQALTLRLEETRAALEESTQRLARQEVAAADALESTTRAVAQCRQAIDESTTQVRTLEGAMTELSRTANEATADLKACSVATSRFTVWTEQTIDAGPGALSTQAHEVPVAPTKGLSAEIAAGDALIAQLQRGGRPV